MWFNKINTSLFRNEISWVMLYGAINAFRRVSAKNKSTAPNREGSTLAKEA